MKSKIHKGNWDLDYVQMNKDKLFVFSDNLMKIGRKGQSVIRNSENSVGLSTKKSSSKRSSAYYDDNDFEKNKDSIIFDILNIKYKALNENRILIFSSNGYGNGLAEMNIRAPKTFNFLNEMLNYNFNYDNLSGKIINKIPGYDEIKKATYVNLTKDNKDIIIPLNNSFFSEEHLDSNMLNLYDLIISGKKISFTHNTNLVFSPDQIVIFKFDNTKNYVLCRISYQFSLNLINPEKWEKFEGFKQATLPSEFKQTHFKYISILDSNNNMILPGDLFSNVQDEEIKILESEIHKETSSDIISDVENLNYYLKENQIINKVDNYLNLEENESKEDKIINMLNEMKKEYVSKKELEEYSRHIINEFSTLFKDSKQDKIKKFWFKKFW